MENYRISQNPGSAKPPRPAKGGRSRRSATKSLSPGLILGGILVALVLILGGFFWVRFLSRQPAATNGGTATTTGTVGKGLKTADKGTIPEKTYNAVTAAIGNKKPSNLKAFYAASVKVVIPKKSINQTVEGSDVDGLVSNPLIDAVSPWDWHVSAQDLAAWQNGPYGQYFVGNVLVGVSADGTVISIGFDSNGQIVTIFIAPVSEVTGSGTSGSSGSTNGGGNTGGGANGSGSSTVPAGNLPGGPNDSD